MLKRTILTLIVLSSYSLVLLTCSNDNAPNSGSRAPEIYGTVWAGLPCVASDGLKPKRISVQLYTPDLSYFSNRVIEYSNGGQFSFSGLPNYGTYALTIEARDSLGLLTHIKKDTTFEFTDVSGGSMQISLVSTTCAEAPNGTWTAILSDGASSGVVITFRGRSYDSFHYCGSICNNRLWCNQLGISVMGEDVNCSNGAAVINSLRFAPDNQ